MNTCILCFNFLSEFESLQIDQCSHMSESGPDILRQHFPFADKILSPQTLISIYICEACWAHLSSFHEFFLQVTANYLNCDDLNRKIEIKEEYIVDEDASDVANADWNDDGMNYLLEEVKVEEENEKQRSLVNENLIVKSRGRKKEVKNESIKVRPKQTSALIDPLDGNVYTIDISKYLRNYEREKRSGTCKACQRSVQWSKCRLAAHKRVCVNATAEEKRIFAKRSYEVVFRPGTHLINIQGEGNSQTFQISNHPSTSNSDSANNDTMKEEIDMKLANFFYRTGISLRIVESESFKDFIKSLNPLYASTVPCYKTLLGSFLDKQFEKCSAALDDLLDSSQNVTLMSDGWSNCHGDHLVNFCLKLPGQKPFFYSSINASKIIQDSKAVADSILEIIEKIGPQKFSSFVSDDAPVMKASWKIIEKRYPHITINGCAMNCVDLLIKEIATTQDASKTSQEAEKIIKFIKNHDIVKVKFNDIRKASKISHSLTMPVSNRWCSLYTSLQSLQILKNVVRKLVNEESKILKDIEPKTTSAEVLTLIKSNTFWSNLSKLVKTIEHPSKVIDNLKSNDPPLSLVYHYFGELYNAFNDNDEIQNKIKKQFNSIYTPSIGLAYLLTPQYAAQGFYFDEDKADIISSVHDFALKIKPEIADVVQDEIISFMTEMATLTDKRKEMFFKMSAKNYWNIFGREKHPALFQIAKPIAEMICSSATPERTRSIFRFVNSKFENRLTDERLKKLIFVYINSVLIDIIDSNDYILDEINLLNEIKCES